MLWETGMTRLWACPRQGCFRSTYSRSVALSSPFYSLLSYPSQKNNPHKVHADNCIILGFSIPRFLPPTYIHLSKRVRPRDECPSQALLAGSVSNISLHWFFIVLFHFFAKQKKPNKNLSHSPEFSSLGSSSGDQVPPWVPGAVQSSSVCKALTVQRESGAEKRGLLLSM